MATSPGILRRATAAVLAVGLLAAYAPPAARSTTAGQPHCAHPAVPPGPAWLAGAGPAAGPCHGVADGCAAMPACTATAALHAPLLTVGLPVVTTGTPVTRLAAQPYGRLALGPPTPPPNS